MTLSTVDGDGRPNARVLLLKGLDDGRWQYASSRTSRKGREIAATAWGAAPSSALALGRWGAGGEQIAVDAEEVVAAQSGQVVGPGARVGLRQAVPAWDEGGDEPHQPGAEARRLVAGIQD